MTAAHLSDDWVALLAAEGPSLPAVPGATARLQHDVAGGPDGEVSYVVGFVDGQVASASPGKDPDADGVFALRWKDAVRVAQGDDDLLVAYMQGRAKYAGNVGKLLDLVPVVQSPDYAAYLARVAASTAF